MKILKERLFNRINSIMIDWYYTNGNKVLNMQIKENLINNIREVFNQQEDELVEDALDIAFKEIDSMNKRIAELEKPKFACSNCNRIVDELIDTYAILTHNAKGHIIEETIKTPFKTCKYCKHCEK